MALKTRFSPLQHLNLTNIFTTFIEMPPRNRMIVLGILGFAVLLILFLPLSLISGKVSGMKKDILVSQKKYKEVIDRLEEFEKARQKMTVLEERFARQGGSLTGRVETLARELGLTVDQLRERPSQESDYLEINAIEVKLSNLTLSQFTEFLYRVEHSTPLMRVRNLQVRPKSRNRQGLDASMEVATFVLKREI